MPDSVKRIAAEEVTYGHREAVFEHYVRRTVRAIEAEDVNALARAVPGHLLEIETEKAVAVLNSAVKMITTNARQWVNEWIRDSENDCLRARGDKRWQLMSLLESTFKSVGSGIKDAGSLKEVELL